MDMQSKLILLTVAFVLVGLVRDYFQRRIDPYL